MAWLIVVTIIPAAGAVVWLAPGRPPSLGFRSGSTDYRARRRPVGPEDAADFPLGMDERVRGAAQVPR